MSSEGIKSQQKFLQDRGLYHGALDGEWGNASVDAMKGWAYRSDSGNLDGRPFQTAPEGYVLNGDELVLSEVAATPAPKKKASSAAVKKAVKRPLPAMPERTMTERDAAMRRHSFTVTGREGDKPQEIARAPAKKAVKKVAKKPTVKKPAAKAAPAAKKAVKKPTAKKATKKTVKKAAKKSK